jgi:hypothetical protein
MKINDVLENTNIRDLANQIDAITRINKMRESGANAYFENEIEI